MANDVEKRVTAKFIIDSSGYNESLKSINSQLKLSQSEFKKASAEVGAFGKSSENLKSVQTALTNQINLQAQKVGLYKKSIEDTTEKLKLNIQAKENLKKSLDEEKSKYEQVVKLYGKESEEAQKVKENVNKLTEEYKKKEKQIESNVNSINNYTVNMNKVDSELTKMRGELQKTNKELATHESKWISAANVLEATSDKMKSAGGKLSSIGNSLSIGVTAPIVGIGAASIKMAMDAVESENLFEVSMGEMAGSARKWSDETSKALGLNAYSVRQNVATYNVMLSSMGLTTDQSLKMSEGLTQLSYDMASFYNLKPEEAFEKLKAGISGEAEPLKALGILVNDTTVQQYALANGIAKTTVNMVQVKKAAIDVEKAQKDYNEAVKSHGKNSLQARDASAKLALEQQQYQKTLSGSKVELTENEKVQARYGLIMKSTVKAQGDLARTMDSPTNKMRIQTEQIKQQAIVLGQKLMPLAERGLDVVEKAVDWINNLNDEQRDMIIKFGLAAAAAGPVLSVFGKIVSVGGGLVGTVGKITGALGKAGVAAGGVGVAAEAAGGTAGLAGLATSLGSVAIAAAPYIAATGLVALAGYGIYKGLTKEVIPSVDLFADEIKTTTKVVKDEYGNMATEVETQTIKISDATKKAVEAYVKMDDEATKSLSDLYVNGTKITNDTVTNLVSKYNDMNTQIKAGMDKQYTEQLKTIKDFFAKSNALNDSEEAKALADLQKSNADKKIESENYVKQIQDILKNAANQNRELTLQEQQQINSIQENMKINAVNYLSEQEIESKVILERLKEYGTRVTTEQASEMIKNATKQRDDSVNATKQQYEQTVKSIVKMRDETHVITSDQADKLIADAQRQRDESINKAEELRNGVVSKITSMNSDITNSIDTNSGKILTWWDKLKNWWSSWNPPAKEFKYSTSFGVAPNSGGYTTSFGVPMNASGTSYFQGGLTTLNEKGYELYDLPRGTRIYNHEASEEMVKRTAQEVAKGIGSKNVVVNVDTMVLQDRGSQDVSLQQLQFLSAL